MNLTDVFYILSAARLGSINDAARSLSISQPTLSNQIKKFENLVGHKVFLRSTKGVILTEYGVKIMPLLLNIEKSVKTLKEIELATINDYESFTIGAVPSVGSSFFLSISESHKEEIDFIEKGPEDLMQMLMIGQIDIAIMTTQNKDLNCEDCFVYNLNPILKRKIFHQEDMLFIYKKDNKLRTKFDFENLSFPDETTFILLAQDDNSTDKLNSSLDQGIIGRHNKIVRVVSCEDAYTILLNSENSIAILPRMATTNNEDLAIEPLPKSYSRKLQMIYRNDNIKDAFMDIVASLESLYQ